MSAWKATIEKEMWKQFKANEKEDRETEKNSTNYKEPQVINKIKKKQ